MVKHLRKAGVMGPSPVWSTSSTMWSFIELLLWLFSRRSRNLKKIVDFEIEQANSHSEQILQQRGIVAIHLAGPRAS